MNKLKHTHVIKGTIANDDSASTQNPTQSCETVKYGPESRGNRKKERLRWRAPPAIFLTRQSVGSRGSGFEITSLESRVALLGATIEQRLVKSQQGEKT
jgi:hypothetical protein